MPGRLGSGDIFQYSLFCFFVVPDPDKAVERGKAMEDHRRIRVVLKESRSCEKGESRDDYNILSPTGIRQGISDTNSQQVTIHVYTVTVSSYPSRFRICRGPLRRASRLET